MRKRGVLPWKGAPQADLKEREARKGSVARWRWLGLRTWLEGAIPPLGHELIEFGAVPGEAQPREEILELALLIFEALQRLLAIVVEGPVAARRGAEPVAAPHPIHPVAHFIHLFLHPGHLVFPAIATVIPAEHRRVSCIRKGTPAAELSPSDKEAEKQQPDRPPPQKPQDRKNDWHGILARV